MNAKLWILSLCLFCGIKIFSQNENDSLEAFATMTFVESMPEFRKGNGSFQKLQDFIARYQRYPKTAWEDSIEGRVIISFTVETSGETDNHKVVRGVREDLDNEALRVGKLLKFEVPAMQRGRPIRTAFILPIFFDLKRTKSIIVRNIDFSEDTIQAKAQAFIISHSGRDFFDCLFELGVVQINMNQTNFSFCSVEYYIKSDFQKCFYYQQVKDKKTIATNETVPAPPYVRLPVELSGISG